MKKLYYTVFPLSVFHLFGLASFQLAIIIFFFDRGLAVLPLVLFATVTFAAPFFVRSGYFLPVTSRGGKGKNEVALTVDDGPDPGFTPSLLDLLDRYGVKATFFVTGKNAERNGDLIADILSRGHTIGNHSYTHDPFLMLRTGSTLKQEIEKTQEVLKSHGVYPLAFRGPAGITNPRLWKVLLSLGMHCVNFSCRAFDRGNRKIDNIAKKILGKVRPGDIVLLHDRLPGDHIDPRKLLNEIDELLSGLNKKNLTVVSLEDLTGKPVMAVSGDDAGNAVAGFYNGIAGRYDSEQTDSSVSFARKGESEVVFSHFYPLIERNDSVLEIGAGTGMYTLDIAGRCGDLTAVEISMSMLEILVGKAGAAGLNNITAVQSDINDYQTERTFDIICSFSSFEYIGDIEKLISVISGWLRPGGRLYFTTANKTFLRFFGQIGNSMRQGIWLYARNKKSIERILHDNGYDDIRIADHVLKTFVTEGILLEVSAVKKG